MMQRKIYFRYKSDQGKTEHARYIGFDGWVPLAARQLGEAKRISAKEWKRSVHNKSQSL